MNLKLSDETIKQLQQLKELTAKSFNKLTKEAIAKYYAEQNNGKAFNYGELLTIYDGLQKLLDTTSEHVVVNRGKSSMPFEPVKVTVLMSKVKTLGEEMEMQYSDCPASDDYLPPRMEG